GSAQISSDSDVRGGASSGARRETGADARSGPSSSVRRGTGSGASGRSTARPADREAAIVAAARGIAESEGWPAVTVRRLAAAIGYSQPVLYQHFPKGRPSIVAAVARSGFAQLEKRVAGAEDPDALTATARAYLAFAREHAGLYAAMFEMPSLNRF